MASPSPEEIEHRAEAWLLAAPALTEDEVRSRGHNPDDPDLICLEHDGRRQWPAFQFDDQGEVHPIVRTINRQLNPPTGRDPWGTADWWLGHNGSLEGNKAPAELIGQHADDRLLRAARGQPPEL